MIVFALIAFLSASNAPGSPLVAATLSDPRSSARSADTERISSVRHLSLPNRRTRRHAKRTSWPLHRRFPTPLVAVAAATHGAVLEPASDYFMGAAQVYPWKDGALYRLYAAPEHISDVALQPGENLVSVAAGDTTRWVIGDTSSGSGGNHRTHVLVKPVAPDLRTNIIIATDKRLYQIEAVSTASAAIASISWTYPQEIMISSFAAAPQVPQASLVQSVAVDSLNFDYHIEGDDPSWRPVRAFDDGHQVFIEFPATLGDGEAPPLFIVGEDGRADLVNYRQKGRYYIVDRLFVRAELRLGAKHQKVVRIVRDDGSRRRWRAS